MKTKLIVPIILCIIVGFFMGQFLINQYDNKEKVTPVFNDQEKVFFIQQGVYSSKESMEKNVTDFAYYIYNIENEKYYVYIGITKESENVEKLKGYFKDIGYDIYVKEITVSNSKFLEALNQYDILLSKTTDKATIKAVCSQILAKYEELVIGDEYKD
jgi:uncharacterized protein YneF (UPF0154 family)